MGAVVVAAEDGGGSGASCRSGHAPVCDDDADGGHHRFVLIVGAALPADSLDHTRAWPCVIRVLVFWRVQYHAARGCISILTVLCMLLVRVGCVCVFAPGRQPCRR